MSKPEAVFWARRLPLERLPVYVGGVNLTEHAVAAYVHTTRTAWYLGIVGISEVDEREAVLTWLCSEDEDDPRGSGEFGPTNGDIGESGSTASPDDETPAGVDDLRPDDRGGSYSDAKIWFVPSGLSKRWVFTKGDPDPYPSIPHGHFQHQKRAWPKLDPYVGRAFKSVHTEDRHLRLCRREMISLWNDESFRGFCHDHLAWFICQNPGWQFSVPNPMRLPRWRSR